MNSKTITAIYTGTSYSILKLSDSKVDPYTRAAIGSIFGFALALSSNSNYRYIGIDSMIAGALQLIDVAKGGKLVKNLSALPVYTLGENSGITILEYGQVPSGSIDGFTFKGLNGVYAEIGLNNKIQYTPGFGRFINQTVRSGGYKNKQWVNQQKDLRWHEPFMKSQ